MRLNQVKQALTKLLKQLMSYIPTPLPVGIAEYNDYVKDIRLLSGKGTANVPDDDFRFVVASMILHLGPQRATIPKNHFVRSLHKAAANQVVSHVIQDIKHAQEARNAQSEALPEASDNVQT